MEVQGAQEYWNVFENLLIAVVDELAPLTEFAGELAKNAKCPKGIKNALNVRSRLLKTLNKKPSQEIKIRIREMDKTIRNHFRLEKRKRVRKGIVPGNSSSLWKAVNLAKDLGIDGIPEQMHMNGILIGDGLVPDYFAEFFLIV